MSPIVREVVIGDCRLIQGDCLAVMPLLGKVDAVVTDPPYGIGYNLGAGGKGLPAMRNSGKPLMGDDRPFDPAPFLAWPCILWGANHYASRLPHGRWLAWNKLGEFEPFGDDFSDVEFAWQNERKADRIFSHLWKGARQASEKGGKQRWHPTQKPVALMEWCLGCLPNAQTILDPFMGSGTTLVACAKLGRKGIGIELDPGYFDIAVKRVQDAYRQPDMFIAPPLAPVQEAMEL